MIHVCYGLYDATGRYSKFTGTSILSMFENITTPPRLVTVHILHDNTLTDDNRDKFSYIAGQYNQLIKFYNVEKICATELENIKKAFSKLDGFKIFSIGTLFRLLIPQIFSEDIKKIIYLDADVVVNMDISELWKVPLEDKVLAAVPEMKNDIPAGEMFTLCKEGIVNAEDYFNAGILYINLEKWRGSESENFQAGIKFIAENPKYSGFMDQEIFNYCFSKKYVKLPVDFNCFPNKARERQDFKLQNRNFHFVGASLQMNMSDPFNRLWFKYFTKTCWFDEEIISHFYESLISFNAIQKDISVQVSALMSGKFRVFFVEPINIEFLNRAFYPQKGDEIITAVNQESITTLKESMKASAGSKLYLILIGSYENLRAELMKEGFAEGRDFVNAVLFLSNAHNVPLNTHNFIKLL